jgi:hypothetical protein
MDDPLDEESAQIRDVYLAQAYARTSALDATEEQ